jgi:hypothetical protein
VAAEGQCASEWARAPRQAVADACQHAGMLAQQGA